MRSAVRVPRHRKIANSSDDEQRAHQPQLFSGHGKDEIGVGLGKIEQLLLAFHEAQAGHAAGAHRDQRLNDVEAACPAGSE